MFSSARVTTGLIQSGPTLVRCSEAGANVLLLLGARDCLVLMTKLSTKLRLLTITSRSGGITGWPSVDRLGNVTNVDSAVFSDMVER